jgi:penicillin G amidase
MSEDTNPKRGKRRLRYLMPAAALTGTALGARAAWRRLFRRSLPPRHQQLELPALRGPVEILRDKWGVPHIYAQNERDLFVAQGFVHAQDRLFQMEVNRRVGSGRVSEIVGSSGLVTDRMARYFGWGKVVQAQIDGADEWVLRAMDGYSAGVNAYIALRPLPPEFSLLRVSPELWDLSGTAAIGAVLAWGLAVNWESELLRLILLDALGPEKAFEMTPLAADSYTAIIPDSAVDAVLARELLAAYRAALLSLPLKTAAGGGGGSNNWVVSGDHTATGRPILANDPHLPPTYPALWYENHLVAGDYNVTGFTMPGVPGVVIGHNEHIAWGYTNAFPDVQDVYVERFHESDPGKYEVNGKWVDAEIREEVINVRGQKPVIESVRYTRHGPVFSDLLANDGRDLSLRWTAYHPHNHLRSIMEVDLARGWDEFREGLRSWGFPSQNIVYADIHGNIGYAMPGKVPERRQGAGLMPVPGWHDDYEWAGWIPYDQLPALHNPKSGKIVTANNRVHGESYPHLLTGEWLPDYRARRIHQLLDRQDSQTLQTHAQIQLDTLSLQAVEFLGLALPQVGEVPNSEEVLHFALSLLQQWDGDMRVELVAYSIYSGWLVHFSQFVIRQAVGLDLARILFKNSPSEAFQADPFLEIALDLSIQWLQNGAPEWVGDIGSLLLPALRKTIGVLQRDFGEDPQNWLWGNMHQIVHEHPLTRVPGLGRSWKTAAIPIGGDGQTVNQADVEPRFPPNPVEIIASCRLLMDVGEWDNSLAVLPGGQSGNPASPHYEDGLLDWRNGRYHPLLFSRARVEAAAKSILLLGPEAAPKMQKKPENGG